MMSFYKFLYQIPINPPGPALQWINAFLHREPIASLFYGAIWSVYFTVAAPVALIFLPIQAVTRTLLWTFRLLGYGYYEPSKHEDKELAVVITGCDSGFGKDLALQLAEHGYQVFAGCLLESSFEQFRQSRAIPVKMDVCSDKEVDQVASRVGDWLSQESTGGKKRLLHALINNAGVGSFGTCDLLDLAHFEKDMKGVYVWCMFQTWFYSYVSPLCLSVIANCLLCLFRRQSTTWVYSAAVRPSSLT